MIFPMDLHCWVVLQTDSIKLLPISPPTVSAALPPHKKASRVFALPEICQSTEISKLYLVRTLPSDCSTTPKWCLSSTHTLYANEMSSLYIVSRHVIHLRGRVQKRDGISCMKSFVWAPWTNITDSSSPPSNASTLVLRKILMSRFARLLLHRIMWATFFGKSSTGSRSKRGCNKAIMNFL